jgi:hypothetical protein
MDFNLARRFLLVAQQLVGDLFGVFFAEQQAYEQPIELKFGDHFCSPPFARVRNWLWNAISPR